MKRLLSLVLFIAIPLTLTHCGKVKENKAADVGNAAMDRVTAARTQLAELGIEVAFSTSFETLQKVSASSDTVFLLKVRGLLNSVIVNSAIVVNATNSEGVSAKNGSLESIRHKHSRFKSTAEEIRTAVDTRVQEIRTGKVAPRGDNIPIRGKKPKRTRERRVDTINESNIPDDAA